MNFSYTDSVLINNNNIEKPCDEKYHLSVSFNSRECARQTDDNKSHILDFYEDESIEKPKFIKGSGLEHTIESRWVTPCSVIHNSTLLSGIRYIAYYHPQIYILAKNIEFRKYIIENALKSLCLNEDTTFKPSYTIVPSIDNNIVIDSIKPKYELNLFSSRVHPSQYFQLNVWLPNVISSKSIILECNMTNVLVQTERPFHYELNLRWPHQLMGHKIILSTFINKERRLSVIAEKFNLIEESEEETTTIAESSSAMIFDDNRQLAANVDTLMTLMESYEPPVTCQESVMKRKKNLMVTFSALDTCVVFQETEPVSDIGERPRHSNPAKTKDGCSTKRYTYQMNKKPKIERSNHQQGQKAHNMKKKRNGHKKKQ